VSLSEQLLGELALYGTPLLFGITVISCAGVPLPASLLLIAAGSFADHGEMNGPLVVTFASLGAVLGDQIGYMLGRWGDRALTARVSRWLGSEERLAQAEAHARKWGGTGIFITRWLATPLGPFVNLASGFMRYSWFRFLLWDIVGEVLWVALYVGVGEVFSHRVQMLSGLFGQVTWAVAALFIAMVLGWMLWRRT
jgi:membrane-associated protein